jgi:prepilin-type N-terminal cleavage/methylation domain-containing protein
MKNIFQKLQAFTLIELLVVISIIGILAALLLANFAGIRDRADDAKNKNNLKQVQTALRMMYNDSQSYPDVAAGTACSGLGLGTNVNASDIPATCKYERVSSDSFRACISLNNGADSDGPASVTRCGGTAGVTTSPFCVCSN